uniref:DUF834 domain-containing protein n=1 Tax=Oryza punctata TaxID=4537 RepID=A0A0E0KZF7_ORYPU
MAEGDSDRDGGACALWGRRGRGEAHRSAWNDEETATAMRKKMMSTRVDVGDGAWGLAMVEEDVAEGEEETAQPVVALPRLVDVLADAKRRPEHATVAANEVKRHDGGGASVALERLGEWEEEASGPLRI